MRDFIDGNLIGLKLRIIRGIENLRREERGDTNFVAIIVIIVIIMAIAVLFKEQLSTAVEKVFDRLNGFIDSSPSSING